VVEVRQAYRSDRTGLDRDGAEETGQAGRRRARGVLSLDNPLVVASPRRRAQVTAELAGLKVDEVSPLLAEWDYGEYEGLTTKQIRQTVPDWLVWTHGCPGGESLQQVSDRADQAIAFALEADGVPRCPVHRTWTILARLGDTLGRDGDFRGDQVRDGGRVDRGVRPSNTACASSARWD